MNFGEIRTSIRCDGENIVCGCGRSTPCESGCPSARKRDLARLGQGGRGGVTNPLPP